MISILLIGLSVGAHALNNTSGVRAERSHVVGHEAVRFGECQPIGSAMFSSGKYGLTITERLDIESYTVTVNYRGMLGGSTESVDPGSTRLSHEYRQFPVRFTGANAAEECAGFVELVKKDRSARWNDRLPPVDHPVAIP